VTDREDKDAAPSLRLERRLLRTHGTLVAIDEVGRGALAGPVFCGAVLLDADTPAHPRGLRDSKLLSARRRSELAPLAASWARSASTGSASALEVDRLGILRALRLAALRAVGALAGDVRPGVVLLDGPLDWITPDPGVPGEDFTELTGLALPVPPVVTRVRGDRTCASLSAASVVAKVARDGAMDRLAAAHPGYAWERNKGYASPAHVDGLRRLGPCAEHRRSWSLPGVDS